MPLLPPLPCEGRHGEGEAFRNVLDAGSDGDSEMSWLS